MDIISSPNMFPNKKQKTCSDSVSSNISIKDISLIEKLQKNNFEQNDITRIIENPKLLNIILMDERNKKIVRLRKLRKIYQVIFDNNKDFYNILLNLSKNIKSKSFNTIMHIDNNAKLRIICFLFLIPFYHLKENYKILKNINSIIVDLKEDELIKLSDYISKLSKNKFDYLVNNQQKLLEYQLITKKHILKNNTLLPNEIGNTVFIISILEKSNKKLNKEKFQNEYLNKLLIELKPFYLRNFNNWYNRKYYFKYNVNQFKKYFYSLKNPYKNFSFIDYSFLLNTNTKQIILRMETNKEKQNSQIRLMSSNLDFTGIPFLVLPIIRRERIIEDSLNAIHSLTNIELKLPLKVIFLEEEGVDQGGVSKEYFQIITKKLLVPNYGMFIYNEKSRTLWFNSESYEARIQFELVGTIIGLAIYNNIILDIQFPNVLFKKLLNIDLVLEDLIDFDEELYHSLNSMLNVDDISEAMLTFEISYSNVWGEQITKELVENGKNIDVTNINRKLFVKKYIDFIFNKKIEKQYKAFRDGFFKIINVKSFSLFNHNELELLICGSPNLNFHELEKATKYEDGYTKDSKTVKDFWSIVHNNLDKNQKRSLLKFITASDRAPINGLGSLNITISRQSPDSEQLPTSHTCFNHFLIPEYSSKEKMLSKLMIAIKNTEGFGLI